MLIKPLPGSEVCDFCSDDVIYAAHGCKDFVLRFGMFGSTGGFAACAVCHIMIVNEDWNGLLERCLETFLIKNIPVSERKNIWLRAELSEYLRSIHEAFRANRTGKFKVIPVN
jgi:hypothetical protein